jgi:hypothetical protein
MLQVEHHQCTVQLEWQSSWNRSMWTKRLHYSWELTSEGLQLSSSRAQKRTSILTRENKKVKIYRSHWIIFPPPENEPLVVKKLRRWKRMSSVTQKTSHMFSSESGSAWNNKQTHSRPDKKPVTSTDRPSSQEWDDINLGWTSRPSTCLPSENDWWEREKGGGGWRVRSSAAV